MLEVVAGSKDAEPTGSLSPSGSLENASQATSPLLVVRKMPYNEKIKQDLIQELIRFIQKEAIVTQSVLTSSINEDQYCSS